MTKLSLLILTHNRLDLSEKYIPKMCERIGKISHEILILDNASTDGSCDWAYQYARANPSVTKFIANENNTGMEAINDLAREAKGEYILKVDDDIEVPDNFGERLVKAFEEVKESKLLFLGWDMPWGSTARSGGNTFATRSGLNQYSKDKGRIEYLPSGERVLINYHPTKWMINGVCRLCPRDKFLEIGGHPEGVIYGVDHKISVRAEEHGYYIGFFSSKDMVLHYGGKDSPDYRQFKNKELRRVGSPFKV